MSKITIVGAGLSGMTAGINLAKQGYEVTILEKEKKIGGSPAYHPSLHVTPVDLRLTSEFTGIELYDQLPLCTDFQTWIKDKRLNQRLNNYGVERGSRPSSLDSYLYKKAKEAGIKFEFGRNIKKFSDVPPGSLIATGLMCTMDDFKNIDIIKGYGYSFIMESDIGPASWQFKDIYSPDYFYGGAMNGIVYGLVFAREKKVEKDYLKMIEEQFYNRTGLEIKAEWKPFFCEVMLGNSLFFGPGDEYILTGSASGSYDPFFGFGIVGALTSGKISSLAVRDPQGAKLLFERINRNHDYLFKIFKIIDFLPDTLKLNLFKALPDYYKFLKPVFGRVGEGIPGYPRNWVSEITGNAPNML